MRDSMIFYRSFFESLNNLPDENQLEIYKAIFEYGLNFKLPENLSSVSLAIFTLIKPQIEANLKRYENGIKPKNKQNGSKTEAKTKQDLSREKAKDKQTISNVEANKNVNDNVECIMKNVNDNNNQECNALHNVTVTNSAEFDFDGFGEVEIKSIKDWITYKKEKKQPYKPTGLKALRTKLLELKQRSMLVQTIEFSMAQNYNGIFEKSETKGRSFSVNEAIRNCNGDRGSVDDFYK